MLICEFINSGVPLMKNIFFVVGIYTGIINKIAPKIIYIMDISTEITSKSFNTQNQNTKENTQQGKMILFRGAIQYSVSIPMCFYLLWFMPIL